MLQTQSKESILKELEWLKSNDIEGNSKELIKILKDKFNYDYV